jgi:glycosyltransferase involved in cell wall biosynthesis
MKEEERIELELARREIRKKQTSISWAPKENKKISVVIVTYCRPQVVACTIEQLLEQEYQNMEIIVIDSSPDAGHTFSMLPYNGVSVLRYISSEVPYLGTVRNIGLLASNGEIVIFLDDDFYIDRDFVSRHAYVHNEDIYGQIRLAVGNCIARPIEPVEWVRNATYHCPEGRYLSKISAGAGHYSLKRDAALACGGFIPWVRLTGEETEFFKRLLRNGEQALNAKEIVGVHRCERKGGARDDSRSLSCHIAQRMSDRVLTKLSMSHNAYLPFFIGGVIGRSILSREIFAAFALKGCEYLLTEFLLYSICNSSKVHKYRSYFDQSLRMGRPRVMCGSASPMFEYQ